MIYTITFNPALDYIMVVPSCRSGEVNRTESEKIMAGGKGINCAEQYGCRKYGTWLYIRFYGRCD